MIDVIDVAEWYICLLSHWDIATLSALAVRFGVLFVRRQSHFRGTVISQLRDGYLTMARRPSHDNETAVSR
jgi:hypothetical protein